MWFRSRIVGGRTNHWGRIALRFAEVDFRARSRDGRGDDWPLTYQDLAPYYDKVDRYIGVFGSKENIPSAPDGIFLPPPKPRCSDLLVKRGCDKLGILCVPARKAILTQSVNGRAPCHYCDQCGRGCKTASNFSSSQVLIPPAMATGRLTLVTGAMAREILVNDEGKATGVSYVDKATRRDQQVRAKAVVVAGSSCESARLLLNSRSRRFPQGLANSSGVVGRYLMDSVRQRRLGIRPGAGKDASAQSRRRRAECTFTSPGGNSTARTNSCAATTSSSAAGGTCRRRASSMASATNTKVTGWN